jgi:two-component system, NtrC family, nitrogen regulation response regulator NtrX
MDQASNADTATVTDLRASTSPEFRDAPPELIGSSAAVARVRELIRRVAVADGGVLLVAEPGTDVESIARELHTFGGGAAAPFVPADCSEDSIEAVLLGDASRAAISDLEPVSPSSRLVAARGGALFLANVGELPASAQARLARIARDGQARMAGETVAIRVRIIASAMPGIDADVQERRFRSDLYRRVTTSRIDLPPLRMRADDVPSIAVRLLDDRCASDGLARRTFTNAALALLGAVSWPGNLAELRDVIERVVSSTSDAAATIHVEHVLPALQLDRAPVSFVPSGTLREARQRFERDYIAAVLHHHGWRMADAAQTLGIQRPNLYRKARQLGIPLVRASE